MANPFEFVNQINTGKQDVIANGTLDEESYLPFIINRNFSNFADTVFIANEANRRLKDSPKHAQFLFYLNLVDKRKRFAKWHKAEVDEKVEFLSSYFKVNHRRASEIDKLIPEEEYQKIYAEYHDFGGKG